MKELKFSSTRNSPEIILSPDGVIRINGRSIHENVAEFFEPIEHWINEYLERPADITYININLEYFNSASAKVFIHLFQKLTNVRRKKKKFIFNWFYEDGDDDILERGEYFSSVLDVPFNFIKTS